MERSYQNNSRDRVLRTKSDSKSIKRRLAFATAVLLLCVWVCAGIFTKLLAFSESRNFLHQVAAADAEMLLALIEGQNNQTRPQGFPSTRIAAYWHKGQLMWSTNTDPDLKLTNTGNVNKDIVKKFGKDNWIIASRCTQDNCVSVAIRDTERKLAIRRLVALIFLPLLGVFLITVIGTYLVIKFGLKPLKTLENDLNSIDLDRLQYLPKRDHPVELQPLVRAINSLSNRMRSQLERERSFLDACAHEIRTPVTGLTSQIQALKTIENNHLCESAKTQLTHIERSARKTVRIADQFLGLARTGNVLADSRNLVRFDVCEIIRLVLSDIMSTHDNIHIEFYGPEKIFVTGDPFGIELVIQNLIDNAIKHSGQNAETKLVVSCINEKEETFISVEDNGPGVPAHKFDVIVRRFVRLAKKEALSGEYTQGAGLGLSIVNEVVKTRGGKLIFGQGKTLGGFLVTITIPHRCDYKKAENQLF